MSHSQLLLLSPRDEQHATRFYVLMKGVTSLSATTDFACELAEISGASEAADGYVAPSGTRMDIRMIGSDGEQSFKAIALYFGEDDREYNAPVPLGIW